MGYAHHQYSCQLCGQNGLFSNGLRLHLRDRHDISIEEYCWKHLEEKSNWPVCANPLCQEDDGIPDKAEFRGITLFKKTGTAFGRYCCRRCSSQDTSINAWKNEDRREKGAANGRRQMAINITNSEFIRKARARHKVAKPKDENAQRSAIVTTRPYDPDKVQCLYCHQWYHTITSRHSCLSSRGLSTEQYQALGGITCSPVYRRKLSTPGKKGMRAIVCEGTSEDLSDVLEDGFEIRNVTCIFCGNEYRHIQSGHECLRERGLSLEDYRRRGGSTSYTLTGLSGVIKKSGLSYYRTAEGYPYARVGPCVQCGKYSFAPNDPNWNFCDRSCAMRYQRLNSKDMEARRIAALRNSYGRLAYKSTKSSQGTLYLDSTYERRACELFDACPDVLDYAYETEVIPYQHAGATRHYILDFVLTTKRGTVYVEVKPSPLLEDEIVVAKKAAALQASPSRHTDFLGYIYLTELQLFDHGFNLELNLSR